MWESNPPKQLLTALTGFEDQGPHQQPSTPKNTNIAVLYAVHHPMSTAIACE